MSIVLNFIGGKGRDDGAMVRDDLAEASASIWRSASRIGMRLT